MKSLECSWKDWSLIT